VIWLSLVAFFFLLQEQILFSRQSLSRERLEWARTSFPNAEEVKIAVAKDVELHGWLVKGSGTDKSPLLIYFGGNAEEVSGQLETARLLPGWSLLFVNYRGYGLSGGRPQEGLLFGDAVTIYDYVMQREDIDTGKIVAMGRSLGSGIAVHLAAERNIQGVILVSPYNSIKAVAQGKYPFLPLSLILRHPFNVENSAVQARVPLLALIAEKDRVIPPKHSHQLAALWGGPKEVHLINGAGHNTIHAHPEFWEHINKFLCRI